MTPLAILGLFYGTMAIFGILGELCWITDDYTRDLPSVVLKSKAEGD